MSEAGASFQDTNQLPLLKNTHGSPRLWGKVLVVAKGLNPLTHKLSLPISCTFPMEGGMNHSHTGRWEVGSGRDGSLQEPQGASTEAVLSWP